MASRRLPRATKHLDEVPWSPLPSFVLVALFLPFVTMLLGFLMYTTGSCEWHFRTFSKPTTGGFSLVAWFAAAHSLCALAMVLQACLDARGWKRLGWAPWKMMTVAAGAVSLLCHSQLLVNYMKLVGD